MPITNYSSELNFDVDLPESPVSNSSLSTSIHDRSISPDSSTVSLTHESSGSSSSAPSQASSHVTPPASIQSDSMPSSFSQSTPGLKLVIDKTVKPRDQRLDAQTQSLYYIQVYAVKDHVDYSSLSHSPPPSGKPVYDLIPSTAVYEELKKNFKIIVSRILVKHVAFFSEDFKGLIEPHIPHQHSSEMAKKSEIVSYTTLLYIFIMYS